MSHDSYVAAQKMNPGILGLALQQRQEKERLRCKQQGLPPQITPQVRGPTRSDLHLSYFLCYLVELCCILSFSAVSTVRVCVYCRRQEEGTRCPVGWTMTGTHRRSSHPWMSGSGPQTTNQHLMGEFMFHVVIMCYISSAHTGTKVEKSIHNIKAGTRCRDERVLIEY